MPNLYLWFSSKEERREFVKEMLTLNLTERKGKGTKAKGEESLAQMELGRTKSPYYRLCDQFYFGRVPDVKTKLSPFHQIEVFERGLRRLYYQNSYAHRPGKWLVIQFRQTNIAWKLRQWIESKIPEERMGLNVPVPEKVIAKWKLKRVECLLKAYEKRDLKGKRKKEYLELTISLLKEVQVAFSELFKGDTVYLWERAAFAFDSEDDLKAMEYCLRAQASFQPGVADAFLNLGAFYYARRYMKKAMAAYLEGLNINPGDEHIYYNLASLLNDEGNYQSSLEIINKAVKVNPNRALNHKLKADLHYGSQEYKEAIKAYEMFIAAPQVEDNSELILVHSRLAECYKKMKATEKANWHQKKVRQLNKMALKG